MVTCEYIANSLPLFGGPIGHRDITESLRINFYRWDIEGSGFERFQLGVPKFIRFARECRKTRMRIKNFD